MTKKLFPFILLMLSACASQQQAPLSRVESELSRRVNSCIITAQAVGLPGTDEQIRAACEARNDPARAPHVVDCINKIEAIRKARGKPSIAEGGMRPSVEISNFRATCALRDPIRKWHIGTENAIGSDARDIVDLDAEYQRIVVRGER